VLTVVEEMTCSLLTFAICKGSPAEIIMDGVSWQDTQASLLGP